MKRAGIILPITALLVIAGRANAQQAESVKFGIGVTFNPSVVVGDNFEGPFLPVGLGDIYFPIIVTPQIKLEPQFGLFRFHSESANVDGRAEQTSTVLRVGAGLFYVLRPRASVRVYLGPRVVFVRTSTSLQFGTFDEDDSRTDFGLGPALGGEYLFSSHFSLGGEFQFNYLSLGAPEDSNIDQNVITTNGLIFLRWYF
jgi:opacity protein-like surface antigen